MSWLKKIKGSPNWYLCWREDGRACRRSTGTADRRLAERIRREANFELVRRRFGLEAVAQGPDLAELGRRFLDWSRTVHRPKTTETYRWALGHLLNWAESGVASVSGGTDMTPEGFATFLAEKRAAGLGGASVAILARHLRAFWNWCRARGWVEGNPVRVPKGSVARTGYLTLEQAADLIQHEPSPQWRALWTFLLLTGARIGETCALRREDVDRRAEVIVVRGETTKTGRARRIEITGDVAAVLDALPGRAGRLWPWSAKWVSHRFKRIARRLGFPEWVSAHTLRHTAASWLVMSGVTLQMTAAILGHASSRVTEEHYAHLAAGARAREMEKSELAAVLRRANISGQK